MHNLKIAKVTTLLLTTGLALGSAFADEQPETEKRLETVKVDGQVLANEKFSGTKTQTPIINVPQSLSVVTSDKILEQGFTDIGDILRYTPGASIGQGEGHRDQITIRGQNTTADFFLDGLRDDVQYFRPLYNIEQVEILRGANAMIFGRGGGGGVINRVTKKPLLDQSLTSLSLSADTFGALSAAIDYNTDIDASSAFRINAFAESLDNHRDYFDGDRFAVNPTYSRKFGEDTHLFASYEFVNDERVVDRGVPSVSTANGPKVPVSGYDEFFFGSPTENEMTLQAHIFRLRMDHAFSETVSGNATLHFADYDKAYQNLYSSGIDIAANTVTLDGYRDTTDRQNFIFQANLVSEFATGPLSHTLLVGAEYADQSTRNARFDNVFDTNGDGILDPTTGDSDKGTFPITSPLNLGLFGFTNLARNRESEVQVLSIYIQDQIDLTEQIKLIGGLRFDQFDIDVTDIYAIQNGQNGDLGRKDEEVSPRIGVIYKPQENVSIYASYSKSFLPESGDQFLTLSASTEKLRPESFENQEAGIKWNIRPDLSLTAAIFQLDRDTALTTPDGLGRVKAITETQGVELQLSGYVTDRLSLDVSYSYLDSSIVGGSDDGNDTGQVPSNMFSVWGRYQVTDDFGVGVGATYQDDFFVASDNTVLVPDYTRVDAAAFYTMENGTVLQFNIENLFDETYYPDAHSNTNISTGAPLNARFTIKTKF